MAFAEETGSPRAKVHLDTYHMNIEEDNMFAAIAYAGVARRLGHLHVGESNRRIPGVGPTQIDWELLAKALDAVAYDGAVIMEPFVLTSAHNAARTRTWRDLSRNASLEKLVEDARTGGRFCAPYCGRGRPRLFDGRREQAAGFPRRPEGFRFRAEFLRRLSVCAPAAFRRILNRRLSAVSQNE